MFFHLFYASESIDQYIKVPYFVWEPSLKKVCISTNRTLKLKSNGLDMKWKDKRTIIK